MHVDGRRRPGLVRHPGRHEPREDPLGGRERGVVPARAGAHVGPQEAPERHRLALTQRPRQQQRGQGAAAAQRGPVSGAAGRREGLEGVERHRRSGAGERPHAAALGEQVGVLAQRVGAGGVDQQARDRDGLALQLLPVLHEARPRAVEQEGVTDLREALGERGRCWRLVPPRRPTIAGLHHAGRGEKADQQLVGGGVEVGARPGEGDDGSSVLTGRSWRTVGPRCVRLWRAGTASTARRPSKGLWLQAARLPDQGHSCSGVAKGPLRLAPRGRSRFPC